MKRKILLRGTLISVTLAIAVSGCSPSNTKTQNTSTPGNPTSSTDLSPGSSSITNKLVSLTNAQNPGPTKNYYWVNGKALINKSSMPNSGSVKFSFDSSGRSGVALGSLTYNMFELSKGGRQGTPLDPPAWPKSNPKTSIKYSLTGRTYNGYLYNRSHSIGDSLAGKQSYTSAANFTTGTRPQNVGANQNGGMRYTEETVENYWKIHVSSKTTIWYKVTPVYYKSESMPRGSIVDVLSSDGSINKEVIVINDAEGITLSYINGSFKKGTGSVPSIPNPTYQSTPPSNVTPKTPNKPTTNTLTGAPKTAGGVFYKNCAAVREAGKAPIHKGDPGYSRALDRDGNGVACG